MSREQAQSLIRSIATDSSQVVLVAEIPAGLAGTLTSRQVFSTLKEGKVISDPKVDEQENWVCKVYRMCAGWDVTVTVAIANRVKLYVTRVENCYE